MDIKELIQTKGKKISRHPWELARVKMLDFFIRQSNQRKTIVDIGSGDAFLAASIAKKYKTSSVTAIDINYTSELISQLKINSPSNLQFLNTFTQLDTFQKTDIVILMDVLEHVEDPAVFLNQILQHPSVTTKTIFIITVPAYQSLFSQHDNFLGHHRRYSSQTLKTLLDPVTLKSYYSGYCFNFLVLVRFVQLLQQKLFNKYSKSPNGIHNWEGGKFISRLLTVAFWIEFKISWYLARIGIKIPGLTCYSICQSSP